MTVNDLLSRISSDELTEWMAYFKLLETKEDEPKQKASDVLRSMYATRIVRKKNE